jgi:hypothetical protein
MTCDACDRKRRAQEGHLVTKEVPPTHTCGLVDGTLRKGKSPVHLVNMGHDPVLFVEPGKTACGTYAEDCHDAEPDVAPCVECALVALSWYGPYWQRAIKARAKGKV